MSTTKNLKPVLKPGALWIGENGRVFCTEHAGAAALYTGRDLDGQPVEEVTEEVQAEFRAECGKPAECETCRGRRTRCTYCDEPVPVLASQCVSVPPGLAHIDCAKGRKGGGA